MSDELTNSKGRSHAQTVLTDTVSAFADGTYMLKQPQLDRASRHSIIRQNYSTFLPQYTDSTGYCNYVGYTDPGKETLCTVTIEHNCKTDGTTIINHQQRLQRQMGGNYRQQAFLCPPKLLSQMMKWFYLRTQQPFSSQQSRTSGSLIDQTTRKIGTLIYITTLGNVENGGKSDVEMPKNGGKMQLAIEVGRCTTYR